MSIKNPLTPAEIEPATFRTVAQHLNHCATAPATVRPIKFVVAEAMFKTLAVQPAR